MTSVDSEIETENEAIPYRGEQPYGVPDDLVIGGILDVDNTDERLWVPQSKDVTFRPLLLSVSQGYFVNLLRVRRAACCLGTAMRVRCTRSPCGVAGITWSISGGRSRVVTRSSRPVTFIRWSFPMVCRR